MALDDKPVNYHKRLAMGEKLTGMKCGGKVLKKAKGGAVHSDAAEDKKMIDAEFKKRGLKKGGKVKK